MSDQGIVDRGHIAIADLNREIRHPVLVLSDRRFHRLTGRALVAPAEQPEPFPWRIEHGDSCFAVDLARTIVLDSLTEVTDAIPARAQHQASQVLRFITA